MKKTVMRLVILCLGIFFIVSATASCSSVNNPVTGKWEISGCASAGETYDVNSKGEALQLEGYNILSGAESNTDAIFYYLVMDNILEVSLESNITSDDTHGYFKTYNDSVFDSEQGSWRQIGDTQNMDSINEIVEVRAYDFTSSVSKHNVLYIGGEGHEELCVFKWDDYNTDATVNDLISMLDGSYLIYLKE